MFWWLSSSQALHKRLSQDVSHAVLTSNLSGKYQITLFVHQDYRMKIPVQRKKTSLHSKSETKIAGSFYQPQVSNLTTGRLFERRKRIIVSDCKIVKSLFLAVIRYGLRIICDPFRDRI
jgi:hypothetical protein